VYQAARLATIDIDDDMGAVMRVHNLRVMIRLERRGRMRRNQRSKFEPKFSRV
jgi:hypothetical protein